MPSGEVGSAAMTVPSFKGTNSLSKKKTLFISFVAIVTVAVVTHFHFICSGSVRPSCCNKAVHIPGLISEPNGLTDTFMVRTNFNFDRRKPVPRIVHFCWYGFTRTQFRFYHFVSILSAYKFLNPEVIYFWHDSIPQGELWTEINERVPVIKMRYRPGPRSIYYRSVVRYEQHQSDIVRLEVLMEYGGIYLDLDVVILKSFDPLLKYDTTMGYEMQGGLCNGIIVSKPNAPFLRIWHLEYATFDDNSWSYHSVTLPAKLAETYPNLIHTEKYSMHRPNWKELDWLYGVGKIYNWTNNYAVHLYYMRGQGKIEHSPETIKNLDTTMGEIFRFVYYGKKDLFKDEIIQQ